MNSDMHNLTMLCDLLTVYAPRIGAKLSVSEAAPFTFFAPTNEGFAKMEEGLATLTDEEALTTLLFHVHTGTDDVLMWEDLVCTDLLLMASGDLSRTLCRSTTGVIEKAQKGGGNRRYGDAAFIVDRNNMVCNGVVHVVDEVMLPNFISWDELYNKGMPDE